MPDAHDDRPGARPDGDWVYVLAEEYDAAWEPEDWSRMHAVARRAPPHMVPEVVKELILIDRQRRQSSGLTMPTLNSYLSKFPDLAADPRWREQLQADAREFATPPSGPALPEKIGRYPVNSPLGAGGEAQVFLCFHPDWREQVVVKWMLEAAAGRTEWRDRFARQGELLKGLEHERIVRVYDQGEFQNRPFLVTEYIQGRTLQQYYHDTHPTPDRIVAILTDVAAGLEHAHRSGIYHQDVKPDNILIDEGGRAKLIDFGIAWFRPAWSGGADPHGRTGGTPAYLAPEQAVGGEVTARTDLFALGGVLYFLITGQSLYPEPSLPAVLRRATACGWDDTLLERADVPVRLKKVCRKALAKAPQDRYASATALAAAVSAAVRPPLFRSVRRLAKTAVLVLVFAGTVAAGRAAYDRWFPTPTAAVTEKPNLTVLVLRKGFAPKPLGEVVPLQDGDALQVRFRVPPAVHASLVYVNGSGQLEVLQSYPAEKSAYEAVWPEPGHAKELLPPAGTEFLFVCGRTDRAVAVGELQAAWDAGSSWPALKPEGRFLRVRPDEITSEGATSRDMGNQVEFPESDQVKRRLEQFREKVRGYAVLDGVAFRHQ